MYVHDIGYISLCCGTNVIKKTCEMETLKDEWGATIRKPKKGTIRDLTRDEIVDILSVDKVTHYRNYVYGGDCRFEGMLLMIETEHDLTDTGWNRVPGTNRTWWGVRK